jgi:hypothetical protein
MARDNRPISTGEYRTNETSNKIHILLPGKKLAIAQLQNMHSENRFFVEERLQMTITAQLEKN